MRPPPPPPNPPPPPPPPTYALPVTILAPLPLPVIQQQQPGTGQQTNITTGANPPPAPTVTPVPLAVGTLPAVPVNLVAVAAPVPVFVLGGKLDTPAVPPLPPRPAARLPRTQDGAAAAIRGIGGALSSIAALSGRGLLDSFNAITEKIPFVGSAVAELTRQILSFGDAATATAHRLAAFSPQLAVTEAQVELNQLAGDMRRAQQLGSGLSRFEAAKSALSQTSQDAMADILEKILPAVSTMLDLVRLGIDLLRNAPVNTYNAFVGAVNLFLEGLDKIVQGITFGRVHLGTRLDRIAQNTQPRDEPLPTTPFLDELLGFTLPGSGFTPPRAPGFAGG